MNSHAQPIKTRKEKTSMQQARKLRVQGPNSGK